MIAVIQKQLLPIPIVESRPSVKNGNSRVRLKNLSENIIMFGELLNAGIDEKLADFCKGQVFTSPDFFDFLANRLFEGNKEIKHNLIHGVEIVIESCTADSSSITKI